MKSFLVFAFIAASFFSRGQNPLISAKEFGAALKSDKSMVVIDVQAPDIYAKQHIQGAINIPHKNLYKAGLIEGQFKEVSELAVIFGKSGVSSTSKIVLYDDGSQKYNSRVWWILKYLGATNVVLLHKEASAMEAARIPMTNTPTILKAATFTPVVNNTMNLDMASVKALPSKPDAILLDAREKDEYEGADKDKRSKGHLPKAIFMNFKEVLTPTGAFKSKDEIIATASKFGVTPEKEIVVYCQTGIKASVLYVALKEIAGFPNVKLYAGAYAEWASVPENPFCSLKLVSDHK
jgi:thiosulfate/3-mercaptopyruvate sulfurtransferase